MSINVFDATSWTLVDEQIVQPENGSILYSSSIIFDSQILALYIDTPKKLPTWHYGGVITQLVGTGIDTSNYDCQAFYKRLVLGKQVVIFPTNFTSYSIQVRFPPYFLPSALIQIYEFNKTSTLDTLENQITDILDNVQDVASAVAAIQGLLNGDITQLLTLLPLLEQLLSNQKSNQ